MSPELRFGLAYDVLSPGVELGTHAYQLLRDMEAAEQLGFDSVWFGETHRNKPGHGHCPAPLIAAAAAAARTERLQIGTAVLLPTAYTPLQVAEQAAMVDQLSRGRLILGVAPGLEVWRDFGFENYAFGPKQLQPLMDESLTVLRALDTGSGHLRGRSLSLRRGRGLPAAVAATHATDPGRRNHAAVHRAGRAPR